MFKRLLIPIDFSEQSLQMFECVAQFCVKGNEEMVLLHVKGRSEELTKEQKSRVDGMMASASEMGIKARFIVEAGASVDTILNVARREGTTLIAMASSGKGRTRELLVGSTSLGVIRNSTLPVFIDKFEVREEEGEVIVAKRCSTILRSTVVPLDFTSCNEPVLEALQYLIEMDLGQAVLFHTVDSAKHKLSDDREFQRVKEELKSLKEGLDANQCEILTHVHFGSPAYNIVEVAREFGSSLILMGTHGKSLLHEMTLGSISEEVVRKSPVSLLIIPCAR